VTDRTTAVITMAGQGQRFRAAGYDVPKFEIVVRGQTLFAWSMESLRSFIDAGATFVFVGRRADGAGAFIAEQSRRLGIHEHSVIELDSLTDGQATTALLAAPAIARGDAPFLIYNIDTHVAPDSLPADAIRGAGWIPCFAGEGAAWSFARADADGRVREVREKVRISPHATVGLYWFSSFDLYRDAYERHYQDGARVEAGERYVAPLYNDLIARDLAVYLHEVPTNAVIPLGTPAEVERFAGAG
jgi:NDP-sugar pyrophosphorylase family protein